MIKMGLRIINLKNLDEINAGICDGLTYLEMEEKYPQEAIARKKNKLSYRSNMIIYYVFASYPRGESYLDLISRLEPVIYEVERSLHPIIIVAH
jgi:broad specificity phosphatase PhoE